MLRTLAEYQSHIHPVLQFTSDLPCDADLERWFSEPIRAAIIPTSVFLTNRAGYPTLSRRHQQFLVKLFSVSTQPTEVYCFVYALTG
jgi:type II protein arginine methyltransferase